VRKIFIFFTYSKIKIFKGMKIVTLIGARPQIIKAAALSRAIRNKFSDKITEIIVHTGQHYDANMSQIFIDEMGIPEPDVNLNIGSGSHGRQTAGMITGIEDVLLKEKPDFLVLYGDTNSTLAGAIAASKIHVPVAHIEAGLRSFNKAMPEEINRIMADHVSTLLFSPTETGWKNLIREGFSPHEEGPFSADRPGIFHCGDVMFDNNLYFKNIAEKKSRVLQDFDLHDTPFFLATVHRDNNTDNPRRLHAIFEAFLDIVGQTGIPLVLPLHPRTSKLLKKNLDAGLYRKLMQEKNIKLIPPVSFLDMIVLESRCQMVFTDSGGVQKEAYFFEKPVVILRSETEWKEIVENGCGRVADADKENILRAFEYFKTVKLTFSPLYGDGKTAEFIAQKLLESRV
jgi:UDP-GlcNAc3NAcA epimerase